MPDLVWTPAMLDRLAALWREGLTASQIGERLHVSKSAVICASHRYALPPRSSPIKGARWSDERNDAFRRAWETGAPLSVIAQQFGLSANAVIKHASQMGLERRHTSSGVTQARAAALPARAAQSKAASVKSTFPTSNEAAKMDLPIAPREPVTAAGVSASSGCQWITSNGRPWAFCGAPVHVIRRADGTPHVTSWCREHYRRVYIRHASHHHERTDHGTSQPDQWARFPY